MGDRQDCVLVEGVHNGVRETGAKTQTEGNGAWEGVRGGEAVVVCAAKHPRRLPNPLRQALARAVAISGVSVATRPPLGNMLARTPCVRFWRGAGTRGRSAGIGAGAELSRPITCNDAMLARDMVCRDGLGKAKKRSQERVYLKLPFVPAF